MNPLKTIKLLDLPWPPSVNAFYVKKTGTNFTGGRKAKMKLKKKCDDYNLINRAAIDKHLSWVDRPLTNRLSVRILAYPPDKRMRDLDNLLKIMLDSLQYAKVFEDDAQIDRLLIERRTPRSPGHIDILIEEYKKVRLTKGIV